MGKKTSRLLFHFPKQRILSFGVSPQDLNTAVIQLRWSFKFEVTGFNDKNQLHPIKKHLEPALKVSSEPWFHPDNYSQYLIHESHLHPKEKRHSHHQTHKPSSAT